MYIRYKYTNPVGKFLQCVYITYVCTRTVRKVCIFIRTPPLGNIVMVMHHIIVMVCITLRKNTSHQPICIAYFYAHEGFALVATDALKIKLLSCAVDSN